MFTAFLLYNSSLDFYTQLRCIIIYTSKSKQLAQWYKIFFMYLQARSETDVQVLKEANYYMFETLEEKTEEKAMVQFLERFTDYPFLVKFKNSEYHIGEGEPTFTVNFKKAIPLADLVKSTSLALGEAYMRGDLDIEGNLYEALDHFLGQMGKFSTNESALKKIMFSSTSKKNQEKEVTSHYDIGNDFYKLWLDETMSYSCGYFIHEDDTLYQAQVNKVDYIL